MTEKIDTMNLRAMMDVPEIEFDPVRRMMQQAMDDMQSKEMQVIDDILRHHIDNPIEGELTREKIKAAGIRGVAYDENFPKSDIAKVGQDIHFTLTSGLLGVVQGDWLIGAGGARRPLTDSEREFYDEQDRREQMIGRLVVIEYGSEQRVAYLHGIEHDDGDDYYQFAAGDYSTWQVATDETSPRLATDAEVAAYYLAQCRETAKHEYE